MKVLSYRYGGFSVALFTPIVVVCWPLDRGFKKPRDKTPRGPAEVQGNPALSQTKFLISNFFSHLSCLSLLFLHLYTFQTGSKQDVFTDFHKF